MGVPKVSSIEVLRQIKGDPEIKKKPLMVLRSSREEQDLSKRYEPSPTPVS
jgi:CheY-like chemotaxis protein